MIAARDIDKMIGADAVDPADDRIGTVSQVFIDEQTSAPSWATVRSGVFGLSEHLVPLREADWDDEALHVAVPKESVRHAPHVAPDDELTVDDQARLYEHYGLQPFEFIEDVSYSVHSDEPVEPEDAGSAEVSDSLEDPEDDVKGQMARTA